MSTRFTDVNTPTVRWLAVTIRDHFLKIKEGNIKICSNVPECSVWGLGYHADQIIAIWDTGPQGCEVDNVLLCESIITDTNIKAVLAMIKERKSKGTFSVPITHQPAALPEVDVHRVV
jgi:hypothetical protein